jgi:hypothetical protein
MTEDRQDAFEGWAIVELMGHRRLAGYVREATVAGASMLRLDVPNPDEPEAYATQFYSSAALYCLTPVTEDTARAVARNAQPAPVTRWELPAPSEPAYAEE